MNDRTTTVDERRFGAIAGSRRPRSLWSSGLLRLLRGFAPMAALAAVLAGPNAQAQCQYEITVIQGPEDPFWGVPVTTVDALNDFNQVAGYYTNPLDHAAYTWTEEIGFVPLSFPGQVRESEAQDLNSLGQIVGMLDRPDDSIGFFAFLWPDFDSKAHMDSAIWPGLRAL